MGLIVAFPGYVNAQDYPTGSFVVAAGHKAAGFQKQVKSVTIQAKDRSIESILNEIVDKGKIRLFFSPEIPELQKKTSVSLDKVSPVDAVNTVIKGTNLVAVKTTDGQGIMIRSRTDTASKPADSAAKGLITGHVIDSASGKPVTSATVSIAGSRISVLTNNDGFFRIEDVVPGKHQVTVRMLGYLSQSQSVTVLEDEAVETPKFHLVSSAASLSEVVTTGTGQQRRVEIAHDIAKVNPEAIMERAPVRNVMDILEAAQIPGVLVQRESGDPGSPKRIRIRGIGSISQSNDPVVILDGVWIGSAGAASSRLDDIDPASIESIEVIRGPSAATLFGQDAANGVIVITSKKGQAGPTRWNLSYSRDWGQTYGRMPLFYTGIGTPNGSALGGKVCNIENVLNYSCRQDSVAIIDPNHPLLAREGAETNNRYAIQLDGGTQAVTYAVTLSSTNTIGVRRIAPVESIRYRIFGYEPSDRFLTPSKLSRESFTTAIVLSPRENVSIGLTLSGGQTDLKDNSVQASWNGLQEVNQHPQYSADTSFHSFGSGRLVARENPEKTTSALVSSNITYRPTGSSVITANLGVERSEIDNSLFERITNCNMSLSCRDTLGNRSETSKSNRLYTVRLNASTTLNLGSFTRFLDVRPSIGGDFKRTDDNMFSIYKDSIPVGDRSLSRGRTTSSNSIYVENATAGWYLNSTIGILRRIYFDVGIRQDIGSAIASSKDALYPKIGGSWLVSDESFWRPNSLVTSLRIRSAIGHSAVQPDVNDVHGTYVNDVEFIDGRFVNSLRLDALGNNRLQPERAVEMEIGFDMDLLNDRLNIISTYAHKSNRNTLVNRVLPPSFAGYIGGRKENVAKVRNRNFELSANARAIEKTNALLILNYSLTLSDNIVQTLGSGISPFGNVENRVQAGYPLAGVWARKVLGYRDANRDGMLSQREVILSDSLVYIGWSQPRYRASYGASFTVNNQFVFDSRFAYQSRYVQTFGGGQAGPGSQDINAPLPVQAEALVYGLVGKKPISDIRWNSASITYHLPKNLISQFGGRAVSISLQGSNLGLWSNYIGRDPAVSSFMLTQGEGTVDGGTTPPQPRLYVLDFKVGF